jgi:hypothetical protein
MDALRSHRQWNMPVYVVALISLMAPITLVSQNAAPSPPAILLGTAWYPEQWPESRWDTDLRYWAKTGWSRSHRYFGSVRCEAASRVHENY